ncbi:MAG: 3-deoxy-8-phosphooctulonate synthase [Cyclobacteriaceae bacterium]|nr:3-deoxy-8-phosphooctulonate synthase [Cyclobacteriaceae bacterium]
MVEISKNVIIGNGNPVLFAGPCVIESEELCIEVAGKMKEVAEKTGFQYVFKASFDKANRTSSTSFRGDGMGQGLKILEKIKSTFHIPIVTDIHESFQANEVGAVADVLQIPAFLCRQTSLLIEAGKTGRTVKIKKGQFMAPGDMQYAVEKVKSTGNEKVILTERGSSFGYHTLVVDYRSLPIMRNFAPIVFDVTHSVQQPGGAGGKSGGQREFAPYLARAAAAVGVDGFFIETHPNPEKALSDGPNMIPLDEMEAFLIDLKKYLKV